MTSPGRSPGPRRGQQLVDRHVVEAGQPLEPGHRDGPLAALVGAEHRRLELLRGGRLDLLQRQPLLPADARSRSPTLRPYAVACGSSSDSRLVTHASPLPRHLGSPLPSSTPCPSRHHTDGGHGAQSIATGDLTQRDRAPGRLEARPGARRPRSPRSRRGARWARADPGEAERRARGRTSRPRGRRAQSGRASVGESPPACAPGTTPVGAPRRQRTVTRRRDLGQAAPPRLHGRLAGDPPRGARADGRLRSACHTTTDRSATNGTIGRRRAR